jgi:hypothetical protein
MVWDFIRKSFGWFGKDQKYGSSGAKNRIFTEETYSLVRRFKLHKRLVGTKNQ